MQSSPNLLTRKQVSDKLGLHPDTLRRWTRSGKLRGLAFSPQTIRYKIEDVERLLSEAEQSGSAKPGPKPKAHTVSSS